jgi:dolichol-phosphate mannosyltransferase
MRPLVIIPTYNERRNLEHLVRELLNIPHVHVLVVDDGSPDGTGAIADELATESQGRVSVRHRRGPRGLGRAYLEGIRLALETDADVICQMDADRSHQPTDLPGMLEAAQHADVVIGSRYVSGGRIVGWPLRRRVLSASANQYIRSICSLAIHDCTSGFRCWRRNALAALPLDRMDAEGYAFLVELIWEAVQIGCSIVEVPITFVERRHGASKLCTSVLFEAALLPWRLALGSVVPSLREARVAPMVSPPPNDKELSMSRSGGQSIFI